jgi:hypothetical protein
MHIKRNLMTGALLASAALFSNPASADMMDGLGSWQGQGTRYDPAGRATGDFSVELTRAAVGPRQVETRGQIKLSSGQVLPFESRVTLNDAGFVSESARGHGTGHCFGADFCYSYEQAGNGKASAMTIVIDGPDKIRILTTDLEHGRPVQYTRQVLTKR